MKELILKKVIEVKNAIFATIGVLNKDFNFEILHAMIASHVLATINDIAIITVKIVDYRCIIHNISKSKAINS